MGFDSIRIVCADLVFLSWAGFCLAFLLRKRPPKEAVAKRDRFARLGIVMQMAAYAMVWSLRRELWPEVLPPPRGVEVAMEMAAVPLAMESAWLTVSAVRTLGAQWSYEARLVEGHRLIVGGPYSHIRHPIYTAMLALLVATGLVLTHWIALVVAVVIFGMGTAIRVKAEEKLLREAFGADFEAYARYVPAIFPRLRIAGAVSKP